MTQILTPDHRTMLEVGSAIAPDVIGERGWRSLTSAEAATVLPTLRFSLVQSRLGSGLLFPLTLPDDPAPLYQFRPDRPRQDADGKAIKYEIPLKTPQRLIVHPRAMAALREGTGPIYVTEGAKKVDSLLSRGATPLGGIGVWSFTIKRTAAEKKRGAPKVLLPDWQRVTPRGRQIVIVFDSDAALNTDVDAAEQDLAALLRAQGATVDRVRLPAAPDGSKQGVDDFFARGHSLADVEALIEAGAPAALCHDQRCGALPEGSPPYCLGHSWQAAHRRDPLCRPWQRWQKPAGVEYRDGRCHGRHGPWCLCRCARRCPLPRPGRWRAPRPATPL